MKMFLLTLFLFSELLEPSLSGVTVSVSENIYLCEPGDCTTINGTINGSYSCFEWSSDLGYENISDISTSVCVIDEENFVFTAFGTDAISSNLIVNGSFESGDVGFTSDYTFESCGANEWGTLGCEGAYTIGTNSSSTHTNFASCIAQDQSQYMILNGSETNAVIWCQDISVNPKSKYFFSAWASSIYFENPANLQFTINGTNLANNLQLSGSTCVWENLQDYWKSENNTNAQICIVNLNTNHSGNDFGIDNLEFVELCKDTARVKVKIEPILVAIAQPDELNCDLSEQYIQINEFGQSSNYDYLWYTNNGFIESGMNTNSPLINSPGEYFLYVTDQKGCTYETSVIVSENTAVPPVSINEPNLLNCNNNAIEISTSGNTSGYDFEWIGQSIIQDNSSSIQVDQIGWYYVTVTDQTNHCTDELSIEVLEDYDAPDFVLNADPFDCENSSTTIYIDQVQNVTNYSWIGPDPTITFANTDNINVNNPGIYEVELEYSNGCTRTNQIEILAFSAGSDCCFDINVPADITICSPELVQLNGSITGSSVEGFSWTSDQGYFNETDQGISVNVNQTTAFTFSAFAAGNTNLITNGEFDSGNIGFTSDYVFNPLTGVNGLAQGSFNIDVVTPSAWTTCPAIDGNMMVVNAATVTNVNVYCTSVSVTPGVEYIFSTDVMNINNPPPILQFSINGTLLGSPFIGGTPCVPQQFYETWDSGSNTSATICVVNQNTAGSGNDFALDNVFFGPVCEKEKTVIVTVSEFALFPIASQELNCTDSSITLFADVFPSGQQVTYSWETIDGSIVSSLDEQSITLVDPGIYSVTVTDSNNCTQETSTNITSSIQEPQYVIAAPDTLNCTTLSTSVLINPVSSNYTYEWQLPDLTLVNSEDLQSINEPGVYQLTVTDPTSQCTKTESFEIVLDTIIPDINLSTSNNLDCFNDSSLLSIQQNDSINQILWTGPEQGLANNENTVSTPGLYFAELTFNNTCTVLDSIEILQHIALFDYTILGDTILNCIKDSSVISANLLTPNIDIQWVSTALSSANDTITAYDADWYFITMTDSVGCSVRDSIFIDTDYIPPIFSVTSDTLGCNKSEGVLEVISSESLTNINWQNPNGENFDGLSISTSLLGEYTITVFGQNGCQASGVTTLESLGNVPNAMIAGPDTINCTNQVSSLLGMSNSVVQQAQWTLPDGSTIQGDQVGINQSGQYTYAITTTDGCEATDLHIVEYDTISPTLVLSSETILDCNTTEALFYYESIDDITQSNWVQDNQLVSSTDTLITQSAGQVILQLEASNGCTADFPFIIPIDTISPTIVPDYSKIDCNTDESQINVSTTASTYTIQHIDLPSIISTDQSLVTTEAGMYNIQAIGSNGCQSNQQILIEIDTLSPIYQMEFSTPITCTENEVTPTIVSNTSSLTYEWNNPLFNAQAPENLIFSQPGIYELTVTSDNGCSSNIVAELLIDTISPTLILSPQLTIDCNTTEATYFYNSTDDIIQTNWIQENTSLSSNVTFTSQIGGQFTVEVIAANGCAASYPFMIEMDTITPLLSIMYDDLSCNTSDTEITVLSPTAQSYFIEHTNIPSENSTDQSLITDQAGTYLIQATGSNGCISSQNIEIEIDTISPDYSMSFDSPITCTSTAVTASISTSSNIIDYQWDNSLLDGLSPSGLSFTEPGLYELTVTASNGCTTSLNVSLLTDTIVEEPISIKEDLDCNRDIAAAVILNSTDYTSISWTDSEGLTTTGDSIEVTEGGILIATCIAENGCSEQVFIEILDNSITLNPEISTSLVELTCLDTQSNLTSSLDGANIQTEWIYNNEVFASTTNTSASQPGSYTLLVTDENGCQGETSIILTQNINLPAIAILVDPFTCENNESKICISSNDDTAILSFSGQNSSDNCFFIDENVSGEYNITAIGSNGCESDTIINIELFEFLTINLIDSIDIEVGEDHQLTVDINRPINEIETIEWLPSDGLSCTDCVNPIVNIQYDQTYQVVVTDIYGCEEISIVVLRVKERVNVLIPNIFSPYANSNNSIFKALANQRDIELINQLTIYDRWGNLIFTQRDLKYTDSEYGWNGYFGDSEVESGVYVYVIGITFANGESELYAGDITLIK